MSVQGVSSLRNVRVTERLCGFEVLPGQVSSHVTQRDDAFEK
jgi:hypothetical protein